MPIRYINRMGEAYRLMVGVNRSGGPNYYAVSETRSRRKKRTAEGNASSVPEAAPLDAIPDGYEIYERPDTGQVLVRRTPATRVRPEEREAVESSVHRLAGYEVCSVIAEGDFVVVYIPDRDREDLEEILDRFHVFGDAHREESRRHLMATATQRRALRFVLRDETARMYSAERWCSVGDGYWMSLPHPSGPLHELLKAYVPHLGRESFYELG